MRTRPPDGNVTPMTILPRIFSLLLLGIAVPASAVTIANFEGDGISIYREAGNERLLRRSNLTPLLRGRADWAVVADIAALGRVEKRDWRLTRADCLPPVYRRCLMFLAEAGKTGVALREYDTADRRFVDKGFALPPGPTQAVWYDDNRIMIAANTGPGTLSAKGNPRLLKLWTRGDPIYAATTILAAPLDAVDIRPLFSLSGGGLFQAAEITTANGTRELYHFGWAQNFRRPLLPAKADFLDFFQGRAVVALRENWFLSGSQIAAGSLVAYPMAPLLGPAGRTLPEKAYLPPAGFSIVDARAGRDTLYVLLRGATADRLVSIRKGAPDWPASDIIVPGDGPMMLVAASDLADIALIARGQHLYVVGHGRARQISP